MSESGDDPRPGRKRPRRRLLVLVLAVAVVLVGVATYGWYRDSRTTEFGYPDVLVACRGQVDIACARRAASRAGHEVAWVPKAEGARSLGFVADGDTVVFQQLKGDGWFMTLYSSAVPPGTGAVIPVEIAGAEGQVYVEGEGDEGATYAVEWEHSGRRYRAATAVEGADHRRRLDAAINELQRVRYAPQSS